MLKGVNEKMLKKIEMLFQFKKKGIWHSHYLNVTNEIENVPQQHQHQKALLQGLSRCRETRE